MDFLYYLWTEELAMWARLEQPRTSYSVLADSFPVVSLLLINNARKSENCGRGKKGCFPLSLPPSQSLLRLGNVSLSQLHVVCTTWLINCFYKMTAGSSTLNLHKNKLEKKFAVLRTLVVDHLDNMTSQCRKERASYQIISTGEM